VGSVFAARFVSDVDELFDYGLLRQWEEATLVSVSVNTPTLVLGGNQSVDVVDRERLRPVPLRRRRGGGGMVLVQPGDVWVDWWIPSSDPRWSPDVHVMSVRAGRWWRDALAPMVHDDVIVHEGSLEGDRAQRVVCFAGRGPGEIFVNDRKAVGITQWRVREGAYISSILHAKASSDVLRFVVDPPPGLAAALDHHRLTELVDADSETVVNSLARASGDWRMMLHVITL
jgi:lipoate-protein ligase A